MQSLGLLLALALLSIGAALNAAVLLYFLLRTLRLTLVNRLKPRPSVPATTSPVTAASVLAAAHH